MYLLAIGLYPLEQRHDSQPRLPPLARSPSGYRRCARRWSLNLPTAHAQLLKNSGRDAHKPPKTRHEFRRAVSIYKVNMMPCRLIVDLLPPGARWYRAMTESG